LNFLPYEFSPIARLELEQAVETYEIESPGMGLRFADEVESAILLLRQFPESAPVLRGRIRAKVVAGFPFTIHYSLKPAGLRVLAVAHQRRQPLYWLGRH
jgi:plasmid stabilization system protein ParE